MKEQKDVDRILKKIDIYMKCIQWLYPASLSESRSRYANGLRHKQRQAKIDAIIHGKPTHSVAGKPVYYTENDLDKTIADLIPKYEASQKAQIDIDRKFIESILTPTP